MRRAEAWLWGGVVVGGLFLLGRRRSSRAIAPARDSPVLQPPPLPPRPPPVEPLPEVEQTRLDELLEQYFAIDSEPGNFYQVVATDTFEGVARAALKTVIPNPTDAQILAYIHCISAGPYNLDKYGSPSTSKVFPQQWLVPGLGQGLRAAFLPRNADGVAAFGAGLMPVRTVDPKTARGITSDSAYGLIWLPPVSAEDLEGAGVVTCAPFSYDDGSSTIDPDPELLSLLTKEAA